MSIFRSIRQRFDPNSRKLRNIGPVAARVNAFEESMKGLSDEQLRAKTGELRERASRGEPATDMLPEAFAVVREVSRRVLGMRHFDVQIKGGVVLYQGRIAEMQTGEGKTLVATLPAYLSAVRGEKVHVVTVNDYLARRDREWMGKIYEFLGLDVGLVVPGMETEDKKRSYACPIVYGTNTEFGFDYLRDNMVYSKEDIVQGKLGYAIIDEVDSILIDEARTPLIISAPREGLHKEYLKALKVVKTLREDVHYTVDWKSRNVVLTDEGEGRVEDAYGLGEEQLNSDENMHIRAHIIQALTAKELMIKDVHYAVKDGQVLIVDEFTGRILPGRRFSDGLHQAIEAKEGVRIREETDTFATITIQNFFRMYEKLSGMTGTARTEEQEFIDLYNMDVVSIPPNRQLNRTLFPDSVWRTEAGKFRAIVEEIEECYNRKQPVLVGTRSIERSEMLAGMLSKRGIPCNVLNAKYHDKEAEIIAQAGSPGAVTIATNMAGRGTDILLGGNPKFFAREMLKREEFAEQVIHSVIEEPLGQDVADVFTEGGDRAEPLFKAEAFTQIMKAREQIEEDPSPPHHWSLDREGLTQLLVAREKYAEFLAEAEENMKEKHDQVVGLGGLHVIGTERHEARRIDNQLLGRAGRQGDPGSSRFYLSLEDDLMKHFGGDLLTSLMDRAGMDEDEAIEHNLVSKAIQTAQKRVEANHFAARRQVLEYDNVLNRQRSVIYGDRRKVLETEEILRIFEEMGSRVFERVVLAHWPERTPKEEADLEGLWPKVRELSGIMISDSEPFQAPADIVAFLNKGFVEELTEKQKALGEHLEDTLKMILLRAVDGGWVRHLRELEDLREGIGLQAYGQKDPLVEYTKVSFEMFENMLQVVEKEAVQVAYRSKVGGEAPSQERPKERLTPSPAPKRTVVKKDRKIGRNDPCPCGSGLKYKHCCGKL